MIKAEDLREQVFTLTYCMEGMEYESIMGMDPDEREWYIRRLDKQIKRENEEIKKAGAKNKGRGNTRGRRK